jgi:hypothetical protein
MWHTGDGDIARGLCGLLKHLGSWVGYHRVTTDAAVRYPSVFFAICVGRCCSHSCILATAMTQHRGWQLPNLGHMSKSWQRVWIVLLGTTASSVQAEEFHIKHIVNHESLPVYVMSDAVLYSWTHGDWQSGDGAHSPRT